MCPAGDAQRLVIKRRAPSVHRDASPDLVDDHRLLPALSTTGNNSHCWSRDKAPPPTPLRDPASGKRRPRPRAELDKVDRRQKRRLAALRAGRYSTSQRRVTSSRRSLQQDGWDGTPGVYVPNNSFPGLGTVQRTIQRSQRTYRKYGVRSITRRCVSCPQVAHGARWTRSRRRSTGVPVSVACSGFRGPSGSMCASGKCEDKNDGGSQERSELVVAGQSGSRHVR